MKKTIQTLVIFLVFTATANAQFDNNWAIGFRAGEPLGLNVRKYFDKGHRSFDVNLGTYGFIYGKDVKYFKKSVYNSAGGMVQGIYNFQQTIGKKDNFHVYYGFGGQINSRKLVDEVGQRTAVRQISLGAAVNSGIEMALPANNTSIFIDAGTYVEALPRPFLIHLQFSGGLRLNISK